MNGDSQFYIAAKWLRQLLGQFLPGEAGVELGKHLVNNRQLLGLNSTAAVN